MLRFCISNFHFEFVFLVFIQSWRCGGVATQTIANRFHTGSNPVGASHFLTKMTPTSHV